MCFVDKELLIDNSNGETFRFSIQCAECGNSWESTPVRFSKSGVVPQSEGKQVIFKTLYERERLAARSRAADEVTGRLNTCPVCHRIVCDRCFLICDDLDLCVSCAERLNEKGTPVDAGE